MAIEESLKAGYLNSLTHNYLDKLFYFCLKKTNNTYEAENLTSDILLNVITSLERGNIPEKFEAWVWRIARNRYSVWAKKKNNKRELFTGSDISNYEILDNTANTEKRVIDCETLNLLRRELAFISSEYRNIVVAYYIEDRKIKDIADSLNLPEGTIKARLSRVRKILKEGMNMAREFGKRSYKPENVNFVSSGNQPSGLPWKAIQRKLPKNILLEADNNPLTVEELAIELGIAVPYMEEEVKLLTDATLLKKIGNKYLTNFVIVSKECQFEIWQVQRENSIERSELLDRIVMDILEDFRNLGIVKNNMSDQEFKWFAVLSIHDQLICNLKRYDLKFPEKRVNDEDWGLVGFEQFDAPEKLSVFCNGTGYEKGAFHTYKIDDYNLMNRVGDMTYNQTMLFIDILKNNRNIADFSESELAIWREIENRFAHLDENGNIISDIIVLAGDSGQKGRELLLSHPLVNKIIDKFQQAFDKTVEVLKANCHSVMDNQLLYCASSMIYNTRMMTVHDLVEREKLILPDDPNNSTIAMWIRYE